FNLFLKSQDAVDRRLALLKHLVYMQRSNYYEKLFHDSAVGIVDKFIEYEKYKLRVMNEYLRVAESPLEKRKIEHQINLISSNILKYEIALQSKEYELHPLNKLDNRLRGQREEGFNFFT